MACIRKMNEPELYLIVHPLDDEPEVKCQAEGRMRMTPLVRIALAALQVHLGIMGLLVLYHVLDLAGLFG